MSLKIRKLSYPLGVEVTGVDISKPLTDATHREIHQAFLEHCIVLFRGQPLTPDQQLAFSRPFGKLSKTQGGRMPDYPEVSMVVNTPKNDGGQVDTHFAGSDWHSDRSTSVDPYTVSILQAVEVPEVGGDTQFANLYLAYETLTNGMKKLLEGLDGVHIQEEKFLDHSTPERLLASRRARTVAHPLVKVHSETGRKSLYIGDKVILIAGMNREESKPILDYLCAHSRRQQFVYRHVWQKHDVLLWDNRCTNHNALGNFDRRNQYRQMQKTAVVGPPTGYLYDDPAQTPNLTDGVMSYG